MINWHLQELLLDIILARRTRYFLNVKRRSFTRLLKRILSIALNLKRNETNRQSLYTLMVFPEQDKTLYMQIGSIGGKRD